MGLWLGILAAQAQSQVWTTSALSGRPDLLGRTQLRAEQQVAAAVDLGGGWTVDGVGSLRDPAALGAPLAGDLLVLHVRRQSAEVALEGGRFARLDARGAQHLDGVAVARTEGAGALAAWAGRRWHPETWRSGRTLVGGLGADARLRPGMDASVGAEVRGARAGTQSRGWMALAQRGARGERARLLVESAGGHRPGTRAELSGDAASRSARIGGRVRWEGLADDLLPTALDAPMRWLSPRGYGALEARGSRPVGGALLHAQGGPVLHRRDEGAAAGGLGRAGVSAQPGPWTLGCTGVAAGLEGASLGGAVVSAGLAWEEARLVADLGAFHLRPSTGPDARVWEGRLRGQAPLQVADRSALAVRGELATGVDRVLQPFVRGGVALDLRLGPAGGRP